MAKIESITIVPADGGFIVTTNTRSKKKGKNGYRDYDSKQVVLTDISDVNDLIEEALG